ncbi:hypothetical protein P0D88_50850 [Paraburkholderia sp. RL18-103-BIB-C]|uniref:hypothetical protein n=1 Tax=unclassified Paraburkholderia TaxID=2615204 RepID=UPI0038B9A41D
MDELTFEAIDTARPDTRPHDQIGLAFGRSTVTQRQAALSELLEPDLGPKNAEYRSEIYTIVFSPCPASFRGQTFNTSLIQAAAREHPAP